MMHNILKKLIKVKNYTLIKQKLKICLIFVLLLSSGCLCVSAQSVAEPG